MLTFSLLEATMARQRMEGERIQAVVRRESAHFELARLLGAPLVPREEERR